VAKSKGWSFIITFLIGVTGASVFWLYGPYLEDQISRRVAGAAKDQPLVGLPGQPEAAAEAGSAAPAGLRYYMVTEGKNILLADLKEGRVWRYYRHTREGGFAREDEGFLPVSLHFEGKKYVSAAQVAEAFDKSGGRAKAGGDEASP
jgi:hypothetical protein